jgi:ABC-type amino acid transport substrate-binding protein
LFDDLLAELFDDLLAELFDDLLAELFVESLFDDLFADLFDEKIDLIPLSDQANIALGNAARIDWQEVCPNNGTDEIYIVGNPPYYGSRKQQLSQKDDTDIALATLKGRRNIDYVAIWLVKAAYYISSSKTKLTDP